MILTHWEYWSFHVVYGPIYLYWFWLSARARSFFFFSQANPSIENSGFTGERKSLIYDLIPKQYYPATVLCDGRQTLTGILSLLESSAISFPLIAKPDIGEKGLAVKKIKNAQELALYAASATAPFLIQEYIAYENEVGIFYCRMPDEQHGYITGVVGKEFLKVTGDGQSTIRSLVRKHPRAFLQLAALEKDHSDLMHTVLPVGVSHELVPYGNHARGAKFIDLTHRVTTQLTASINHVCKQIPGFYFGRIDVRYASWNELCAGRNFSVIELNGAGSEPTHMYDPDHSIFFAWKEIIRHWNLLFQISRLNARLSGKRYLSTAEGLRLLNTHTKYLRTLGES
ncbi:MAG: D-alanine--D-alanine ligase [Chitinophagaceae bacterium]|nr:MAG: D-alanine--D-alanine ligase [Chitinophagaceae bacterium]